MYTRIPAMEAAARSFSLLGLLRLVAGALLVLFPRRRGVGLVALRDLGLSLLFLRFGLRPRTVHLGGGGTAVQMWAPCRWRQGRPAVVLVHGFGGNAKWQWVRQIGPLARRFDLYVPDLVFFGRSECDGPERSIGFQARCVNRAMREMGVSSYAVCGISYGGFVAYHMAATAAEVKRAVILTAGVCLTAEERRELVGLEGTDVSDIFLPRKVDDLTALVRRSFHRPPRWLPSFVLRDFIEVMYKDHRKERVELLKDLMDNGVGLDPLPVLNQETLILWGDRDNVFPLHLAYKLQRHLGENAKLEIIKDAGHALQLEKPDLVSHFIEWFLLDSSTKRPTNPVML